MDPKKPIRTGKERKLPLAGEAPGSSQEPSPPQGDFTLKKALFEIAVVAVGVLLALIVDQARQSSADRALADEARTALRAEIKENRVRLATKLTLVHNAYARLQQNPTLGPELVAQGSNFQIEMTSAAWAMAVQTGALRFLPSEERQALSYVYTSQDIYNRLVNEEMNHWTALAAAGPNDPSVRLWQAYAQRVARSVCIASIRIERFSNPELQSERLRQTCQRYRLSIPPSELYKSLGVPLPNTNWRPGGDF